MEERHEFVPMQAGDLDWIEPHETALHAFPWSRGNFLDSLTAGHGAWVMKEEGGMVAYAVVLAVLDEAHLLNISVIRSAQRRGLGRILLEWLHGDARNKGATQFFLEVRPSNTAALSLYQALGYEQIGLRKAYYPAAVGREDAIVMRREL
ncbi:ribosomal protein S18-alanine N-acetyltransferase [Thauera sp.]|uniref:ribosomal protein S18-alanine N-acetyltransferase n=1 Tax=Thauera sp. TaxID=1905334 RepID=UPI0039E44BE4